MHKDTKKKYLLYSIVQRWAEKNKIKQKPTVILSLYLLRTTGIGSENYYVVSYAELAVLCLKLLQLWLC